MYVGYPSMVPVPNGVVGYHNNGSEGRKAALTMIKRYVDEALRMAQDIGSIEG
jgi:hypothetical protein